MRFAPRRTILGRQPKTSCGHYVRCYAGVTTFLWVSHGDVADNSCGGDAWNFPDGRDSQDWRDGLASVFNDPCGDPDDPFDHWAGLTCEGDTIVGINLDGVGAVGALVDADLSGLTSLRTL